MCAYVRVSHRRGSALSFKFIVSDSSVFSLSFVDCIIFKLKVEQHEIACYDGAVSNPLLNT